MILLNDFKEDRQFKTNSESRPLRLLVLLAQSDPTGFVRQLLETLSRLNKKGQIIATVLCIVRKGVDTTSLEDNLKQRSLSYEIIRERKSFDTFPLKIIRSQLAVLQPEAIQSHGYKTAMYAFVLRLTTGIPWIAFYHGRTTTSWKVRFYNLLDRWAMGSADTIITVAKGVEDHFRRADRNRIRIVPNAVVTIKCGVENADKVRKAYKIEESGPLVGFIGRLSKEKGPDLFLETFSKLIKIHPGISALIVGDGPMRLALEKQAKLLRIAQSIRFIGQITKISEIYQILDVLIISSRSEVFPNVLLEAVNSGLPVAATQVGGIPWVAANLDTVILAKDLTSTSIAAAVITALQIDKMQRSAAQEQINKLYSQENRVEVLSTIYQELRKIS